MTLDWKTMRKALKHGGAKLHADNFGNFWLEIPLAPEIAREILLHPAVLPSSESDEHEIYRWRSQSESPARNALKAGSVS
jgi:hypothetical protein